eukprot:CAMPEP_0204359430 /NCGR_PEP_ID=MMETSP0469-20131031/37250_1 /ASSEMBLY_ACC=CAM_ASM_000384 /TAXON_ID=2969 /ORGANISM="Oxyrrhis marina" /LENGTH=67 /DNA_ID=CAMNT_0051347455 /DNA_START=15 /DNA_END=216 /DNA_ORIENTATION=-
MMVWVVRQGGCHWYRAKYNMAARSFYKCVVFLRLHWASVIFVIVVLRVHQPGRRHVAAEPPALIGVG